MCASRTRERLDQTYQRASGVKTSDIPLIITWIFFGLFLTLVVTLLFGASSFSIGDNSGVTVQQVVDIYTDAETIQILFNTVFIGLTAGVLGTLMTAVFTWFVVRTNVPGRKYLRVLAILTAGLPGIIMTFGWITALSPQIGYLNRLSQAIVGTAIFDIYSVWGIILALSLSTLHSGFLLLETPFENLSSDLEEASRVSGYSRFQTLRKVSLPMLFPAIFSAFLLNTIYAIGNFEFVLFFTTFQGGLKTFATEIYSLIALGNIPQYSEAAILSIPYMLLALLLITIYTYYTRKREKYVTVSGAGSRKDLIDLGKYRYAGLGYCLFVWAMALAVPLGGIIGIAFSPTIGGAFTEITFGNFGDFLELNGIAQVFINTVLFAFLGALGVVIVSTLISYTVVKGERTFSRVGDYASTIPLGLPPIVYGLAIFWMILLIPGFNSLYGTILPLVLAIVFMKTPHGVRIISSSMIQIDDELEEASRVCGRSWVSSFKNITIPLTSNGMSNAFLFVFIDAMKELAGIVLLITTGANVFTNFILGVYVNDPGALPDIAAGAMLFSLVIFGAILVQTKLHGGSASNHLQ